MPNAASRQERPAVAANRRWTTEEIREWKRIGRDVLSYLLAAFLILYASLHAVEFGVNLVATMFGTALVLLGLPHVLRLDRRDEDER